MRALRYSRSAADSDWHPLLKVWPLRLREALSSLFYLHFDIDRKLFDRVRLEFAQGIFLRLQSTDREHKRMTIQGFTELVVSRRISKLAKAGGLMVDVGANYGYYTCIWAAGSKLNRVIAFEPSPRNIPALTHNVTSNRLEAQVEISSKAVGMSKGMGRFWLGPFEETGWGGLIKAPVRNSVVVEVVSLDDVLSVEKVDVLKIDTEGADTWVLIGARRLLSAQRIQHVFFEDNPKRRVALCISDSEAHCLLRSHGYTVEYLGNGQYHARLCDTENELCRRAGFKSRSYP